VADLSKALANLERAMAELESYAAIPISNRRDKAGLIQAFEFTFELFWKTFQKLSADAGLEALSPRESLLVGVKLHLITGSERETWSQMLRDRNLSSHTYNAALADEIVARLLGSYLECFRVTLVRVRQSVGE
jgi:nucleotidyltransferase substrate binding protein (TIGR01987 family)